MNKWFEKFETLKKLKIRKSERFWKIGKSEMFDIFERSEEKIEKSGGKVTLIK